MKYFLIFVFSLTVIGSLIYGLGYLYLTNNQDFSETSLNFFQIYITLWKILFNLFNDEASLLQNIFALIVFCIFIYLHQLIYATCKYIYVYIRDGGEDKYD